MRIEVLHADGRDVVECADYRIDELGWLSCRDPKLPGGDICAGRAWAAGFWKRVRIIDPVEAAAEEVRMAALMALPDSAPEPDMLFASSIPVTDLETHAEAAAKP